MNNAQLSTLCYIEQEEKYLMLHRTVKKNDINKDKWIGVGGHFEEDESPDECVMREVKEETGYTLTSYRFRGIVTFVSGDGVTEYMHLFTADGFTGEPADCYEGQLEWVAKKDLMKLNLWAGDKIFFRLLAEDEPFFSLKLVYDGCGKLVFAALNGKELELFDILDEDGNPTGAVQERGVVHWEGSLHRTVHIWVTRQTEEGIEVLLQKRSAQKDSNPGRLDISSAGHIQAGAEVLESAQRELKEELGIDAGPDELIFIGKFRDAYEKEFHGRIFRDREDMHVFLYTGSVDISDLRLQEEEVESVSWVRLDDLADMVYERSEQSCVYQQEYDMVRRYLEKVGQTCGGQTCQSLLAPEKGGQK